MQVFFGLLGVAVYLSVCVFLLIHLIWPLLGWTLLVGIVGGAVGAVGVMLHALVAGHGRLVGPDEVNDTAQFPAHASAYGRDRAWPHYFSRQALVDLQAMAHRLSDLIRLMWDTLLRIGGIEYWWAFWPAWLLPLVVVLSGTVGSAAAGAALLLLSGAALALAGLVWGGFGLLLRTGDGLLRRRNRAEARCPYCFWATRLPSYPCDCGVVHHDVRPSRLGVLWHRCRCGRAMPTTVSRAGAIRTPRCPQCQEELERGSGVLTDVSIPVFGPVSAGKTSLIYAALAALEDHVAAAGGRLVPRGSAGATRYRDGVEQVRAGRVAKTPAADAPVGLVVEVTVGGRTALLHTFDAAGEFFADRETTADMRFLDHTGFLVLVVDPFSIPRVQDETARRVPSEAAPASAPPETAYRATVLRLRDQGVDLARTALAVVVVKADLLAGDPVAEGLTTDADAVRAWLERWGQDQLVTEARRDFGAVGWFLVSSRSGTRADDPLSALAPLRWLGERARLPLPPAPAPTPEQVA